LWETIDVERFDGGADQPMQLATALDEKRAIGDVLGEGVLEAVRDLGEDALLVDQLHGAQLAEERVALVLDRAQALDEALREVPPNDGGGLQRAFRRLGEPVDAPH